MVRSENRLLKREQRLFKMVTAISITFLVLFVIKLLLRFKFQGIMPKGRERWIQLALLITILYLAISIILYMEGRKKFKRRVKIDDESSDGQPKAQEETNTQIYNAGMKMLIVFYVLLGVAFLYNFFKEDVIVIGKTNIGQKIIDATSATQKATTNAITKLGNQLSVLKPGSK